MLLGVGAFWWGAVVVPQLVSLTFPEWLPPSALPLQLNPDIEGTVANAISAASLLVVALLALANAVASRRGDAGWITVGGWSALAVTAAYLSWDEITDFHTWGTHGLRQIVLGPEDVHWLSPIVLSPLIAGFLAVMVVFLWRGLQLREVRVPLAAGIVSWSLVLIYEVAFPFLFLGTHVHYLAPLLEETMEFGGTLLIGLSAALALSRDRPALRLAPLVAGALAAAALLGGLVTVGAVLEYRATLLKTRGYAVYNMFLPDGYSAVQEIDSHSTPLARLRLRVSSGASERSSGAMLWRVLETPDNGPERILREGRMEVAAQDHPRWEHIDFPPLVEAVDRPLAVQLVADVGPPGLLYIGATKTDKLDHLPFWIQGERVWANQKLQLLAHGPSDLSLSKLRTISSDFEWSWLVVAVMTGVGLWAVTLAPALLVSAMLERRSGHGN